MADGGTGDSCGNEGDDQEGGVRAGNGIPIFDLIMIPAPVETKKWGEQKSVKLQGRRSREFKKIFFKKFLNKHNHPARHSAAEQTACTMSFAHSAYMQVCTAALCRAGWLYLFKNF